MALEITWNFKTILLFAGCGMVVLVAIVILLAFCVCWPKRKKQSSKPEPIKKPKAKDVNAIAAASPRYVSDPGSNYLDVRVTMDAGFSRDSKLETGVDVDEGLSFNVQSVVNEVTTDKDRTNCQLDSQRLTIGQAIGSGKFGVVYMGQLTDKMYHHPEEVAVKTVHGEECSKEECVQFLEEVFRMQYFDHRNVLSMIGLVVKDNRPYIVLPYMQFGDLKEFLGDKTREFKIKDLLGFTAQIADGMEYLENQGFVHRDLAARNCMVSADVVIKIADFGLARDLYTDEYYRIQTKSTPLPVRWLAVETVTSSIFSHKSDVWSFGVVMWEVLTRCGKTPYPGMDNQTVVKYVKSGGRLNKPDHVPEDIYNLMCHCWVSAPSNRPSFSTLSTVLHALSEGGEVKSRHMPLIKPPLVNLY